MKACRLCNSILSVTALQVVWWKKTDPILYALEKSNSIRLGKFLIKMLRDYSKTYNCRYNISIR